MVMTAEQAAGLMESEHPRVAECLGSLTEAGVGFVIVGSRVGQLASMVLGVSDLKPPDDWDLQVLPEHFEEAVAITGAEVRRHGYFSSPTGDGKQMRFIAHDAHAQIGNDTIQFMRPLGPALVGRRVLRLHLTAEACGAATHYGRLVFAHDTETMNLYGMRQGDHRMGKHDLERAATIRAALYDPSTVEYAKLRAAQVGWDHRFHAFDTAVSNRAAELLRGTASAVLA
ncbi:MAG TPA: hypothetical protein VLF69_00895 [Candidatus Saccharimonadales bacterium]|nr:hypothetical protein [Candidatus Saccharimonadales bacterium]